MLPIEEGAPEVPFEIFDGERKMQTLRIRLAQFEADYFMPIRPADYPEADRIRGADHHRKAISSEKIFAVDSYAVPEEDYRTAYHFRPA